MCVVTVGLEFELQPFFVAMDEHTMDNWRKIEAALREAGKTDTMFYKRALAILKGNRDPFETWSKQGFQQQ